MQITRNASNWIVGNYSIDLKQSKQDSYIVAPVNIHDGILKQVTKVEIRTQTLAIAAWIS